MLFIFMIKSIDVYIVSKLKWKQTSSNYPYAFHFPLKLCLLCSSKIVQSVIYTYSLLIDITEFLLFKKNNYPIVN